MLDLGSVILTSAFGILERLLSSWIKKRIQRVRVSDIDREIYQAAKAEANRQRLRVDDLESEVKHLLDALVTRTNQLEYGKAGLRKVLQIEYDPQSEESTRELLDNLSLRFKQLYSEYPSLDDSVEKESLANGLTIHPASYSTGQDDMFIPAPQNENKFSPSHSKAHSSPWLKELQRRIKESEESRE